MKKNTYESPELLVIDVTVEQTFLSNVKQVQTMTQVDGDWGDDDF